MRSIDSTLLSKINKQNQTIYENANPKMSVVVARARSSILDASYFTVENIRTKTGITDISIATRRRKAYGVPDGLFDIHLDNGIAKTTFRAYPDKLKIGWQPQFEIGNSKAVAICFNGHWERYRDLWQLATEGYPFIFWVDMGGKLYTQKWDDIISRDELATGVIKIKAVRGWKNINFTDRDHGLIVGYIKTNGKLFYRSYCEQTDGSTAWEIEREVTEFTGTAVNLNMFLTNDYRTGFIIEDNLGKIHWLITNRNWAGMAIAPEYIKASVKGKIDFIEIEKVGVFEREYIQASLDGNVNLLWASEVYKFEEIYNFSIAMVNEELGEYQDYGYRLSVKFDYGITVIDKTDFELKDSLNNIYSITDIERINDKQFIFKTLNFNNVKGKLTLSFTGGNSKGEADQNINNFSLEFTPINLVPVNIEIPEVEVIYNE